MLKIRRFSDGSPLVASYLKDRISKDVVNVDKSKLPYLETTSRYSMALPEEAAVARHGSNSLEQDPYLTDRRMKITLEESRVINWCPGIKPLMPLTVPHDGNSLCHSASVAMWAVEDHNLILRKLVFNALESDCHTELKERWIYDRRKQRIKAGITEEEQEMVENQEWDVQLELAKDTNKSSRPTHPIFEPLEEFHVFVLANTLRRPIIVLSDCDPNYEAPCDTSDGFSGIYLPVLWKSSECVHSPLILGHSDGYFSPLVSWGGGHIPEEAPPDVIPLVLEDQRSLHIRFLTKEEEMYRAQLLKDYLVVTEVEYLKPNKGAVMIAAAQLIIRTLDETTRLLLEFFQLRQKSKVGIGKTSSNTTTQANRKVSRFRCGNKECTNLIEKDHTFPYCTECYEVKSVKAAKNSPVRRKVNYAPPCSPLTQLNIDCATPGCPYLASVNAFPFCQRCEESSTKQSPGEHTVKEVQKKEISVEDRWWKLALGVYDADLVCGQVSDTDSASKLTEGATYSTTERIPFVHEEEEFALRWVSSEEPIAQSIPVPRRKISATGNRSILAGPSQEPPRRKISASGARSIVTPQRRISREQLDHARNIIVVGTNEWMPVDTNYEQAPRRKVSATGMRSLGMPYRKQSTEEKPSGDWRRKVSWINQPCAQWGCSYFASTRTYPYCNQCALQRESTSYETNTQEDEYLARFYPES